MLTGEFQLPMTYSACWRSWVTETDLHVEGNGNGLRKKLIWLHEAVKRKLPRFLAKDIIFIHDNMQAHTAQTTTTLFILLGHHRTSSLQPWPSSKQLSSLPHLKKDLGSLMICFRQEHFTIMWLNMQGQDFYQEEIFKLIPWCKKCLNWYGDYAEK